MPIFFNSENINFKLKQPLKTKQWLKAVALKHKKTISEINYIFCSDEAQLVRNQQFLNHNTYTDIITFDYSEKNKISGDVFISIERVTENATKFNVDFNTELNRVIAHGLLHLCCFKDKTKEQAATMRKKEDEALKIFLQM